MEPPGVPTDRLDGWRNVAETTERPFSAGPISVTAGTVRYERTTGDPPHPFFFASRLRIRPPTAPNPALTRLVERQARAGFSDRLAGRDIEAVDHGETREIAVDDLRASRATLSTFRGTCRVEDGGVTTTTPVEALLAVWEAGEYLLAGGAYSLRGDPERDRRELLGLIRGTRPPERAENV
ncbi:hypothetical protein [Halorubrum sp. DTA46]|uniref:hypothetical protein n=1 Tax=Halorubrum sp. DTA46 TaxID=3402162 RepID=UPI003AAC4154